MEVVDKILADVDVKPVGLVTPCPGCCCCWAGKGVVLDVATQLPAQHDAALRPPLVGLVGPAGQQGVLGWEGAVVDQRALGCRWQSWSQRAKGVRGMDASPLSPSERQLRLTGFWGSG